MKAFYSDQFVLPLPAGHRFPMEKYRLLRERVRAELTGVELIEPDAASDGVLALAHHPHYIERLTQGQLSPQEQRQLGFPWSPQMVERSRRSTGATIGACRAALTEGVAVNLAGGTHHAHADRAEGFCCFNDAAVAVRLMQAERRIERAAIIDLDVHQGDGTASILRADASVFTLSMHAASNYPFEKAVSDLDIALPDGAGDPIFLEALSGALVELERRCSPDLLVYLAGADPFGDDRLGRLGLSKSGLQARDQMVFDFAKRKGLPVAVAMAGGYARQIQDTVDIHFQTVSCALQNAGREI